MRILIINGPNMQLLGKRRTDVYGTNTLPDVEKHLSNIASELNVECSFFQSNHEGAICDRIAEALTDGTDGIVINPAAYTHTSIAIHDALEGVNLPAVEVHVSNIHAREDFRQHSFTASACIGQIAGLGIDGYEWALRALVRFLTENKLNNKE